MGTTAFLVLAHTDPEQLERLILRLRPYPVFLHLDAKSERAPFARCLNLEHVTALKPIRVNWGGFSVVDATMRLVEAALHADVHENLVLLSGQCYPIRPPHEVDRYLAATTRNHIRYLPMESNGPEHLRRMIEQRWFFDWDGKRFGRTARRAVHVAGRALLPARRPPDGVVPHYGSQFWALNRSCARHVLQAYRTNTALVSFFRRTLAPDEMFVHTVVANSTFAESKHLIPYEGLRTYENSALHVIKSHPSNAVDRRRGLTPGMLTEHVDVDALRDSKKFFVRKVGGAAAAERIDCDLLGYAGALLE